ncbi:hypothetical protein AMST5_00870 [freshwater sediment metagenome]|uniref:Uncharacterized protein n=1 Tax=freshwater sediment metagenome TaxID=556182 RepID=A0AA48M129_9ZZZZ
MNGLIADKTFITYLDAESVEENQRVDWFKRPSRVSDGADQIR